MLTLDNKRVNKRVTMILRNKKALEARYLGYIIIGLITLGIVIFLFYQVWKTSDLSAEACHQSVIERATLYETAESLEPLKAVEQKAAESIKLSCKTEEVVIDAGNEEEIEQEIANEMAKCWSMMGEGKVNFFGRHWWNDEMRCVICTKIDFSEKARKVDEINDFSNFLLNENMPGKEITYSDYFAGANEHLKQERIEELKIPAPKSNESLELSEGVEMTTIRPSEGKKYAVVFTLWNSNAFWAIAGGLGGMAGTWLATKALKQEAKQASYWGSREFELVYKNTLQPIRGADGRPLRMKAAQGIDLTGAEYYVEGGQRVKLYNPKIGEIVDYKGGQRIPVNPQTVAGRALKVRPVATFKGTAAAAILTNIIGLGGDILTIYSYSAASKALDSLKKEKYIGGIDLVEYSADELEDLECTNLDVTP